MTHHVPENFCDTCGALLNGATHPGDPTVLPSEGMLSVCMYCCTVTLFDKDLRLRPPTPEELADPEVKALIEKTIAMIRRMQPPKPR